MANPAATTPGGTVRFQTNVPEVIELEFARGKQVSSQFGGDQVMYSLTDGRRMYLPPFVAQKIEDAGIGAHTPFSLCKKEVTHGNRRSVEYVIGNLDGEAEPFQDSAPAVPKAAVKATLSSPQHISAPAIAPPPPPSAPRATAAAAGDDMDLAAMIYAHIRAIDVAHAAESYAAERGLAIRYTSEDVRCIAAALFIQQSKGGAR